MRDKKLAELKQLAADGKIVSLKEGVMGVIAMYNAEKTNIETRLGKINSMYRKIVKTTVNCPVNLPETMEYRYGYGAGISTYNIPRWNDAAGYEQRALSRLEQLNNCINKAQDVLVKEV